MTVLLLLERAGCAESRFTELSFTCCLTTRGLVPLHGEAFRSEGDRTLESAN